ncbi:MAG: Asp-tRNA(Asn)/Glu-tRNA(Gln) amidotransferase subunit GatC [Patescibacteria group bacterium]
MISKEEVKKIADLARIRLSLKEMEKMTQELGSILGYVEQVKEISDVSTKNEEILKNVFREDENINESGFFTKKILDLAPRKEGDYIKVKKIL